MLPPIFYCSVVGLLGEENSSPLQYSCLENPRDRGAWWAAVHGVTKSQTRLSDFTFTFHFPALEKEMATHSILPGESQGRRSLLGYSPRGRKESDTTEQLHFHFTYLTYMQSISRETLGWKKHKLESRLLGEISITLDMQMTPPLWQKVKKN